MTVATAMSTTSWMPTRKWFSALVAGLVTILGHGVVSKGFDTTEAGELFALLASLAIAYGVPNA